MEAASLPSPAAADHHRSDHASDGLAIPTLSLLSSGPNEPIIGDPVSLTDILSEGRVVTLITMAWIYDPSMDVGYAVGAYDLARGTTNRVVFLTTTRPADLQSASWCVNEGVWRLENRNIRVYEPSPELIAFLGIAGRRDIGLANGAHRFRDGRLVSKWVANAENPRARHIVHARHVLCGRA